MTNPMVLFEKDHCTDPTVQYDFDLLSSVAKKKNFVEKLFQQGCIQTESLAPDSCKNLFICYLHKVYLERSGCPTDGLKGKMTFEVFSDYFIGKCVRRS